MNYLLAFEGQRIRFQNVPHKPFELMGGKSKNKRLAEIEVEAIDDEVPNLIQILRVGNFSHPFFGDFDITEETLISFKENFDKHIRKVDLALDYGHDAGGPASAWFTQVMLLKDDTELWIEIDWTLPGRTRVKNKEYRYTSADFQLRWTDEETGEVHGPTLFGAALTNRPFVKDMDDVVSLAEFNNKKENQMKLEEATQKITDLSVQLAEEKTKVIEQGVELKAAKVKLSELEADNKKAKEEAVVSEKKTKFDTGLKEGKFCEAQRESYMSGDTEKFASLQKAVNLSEAGNVGGSGEPAKAGEPKNKDEAEDKVIELAEKMVSDKKAANLSEAQSKVLSENPKLEALISA